MDMGGAAESTHGDPWWLRHRADLLALSLFLAGLAITMWHRWVYDNWLIQNDIMPFFLPWFELVGDRLRQLDVPGWTLAFSSGSPLAGDPSAGWMYGPVMIAFALFDAQTAFKVMILLQTLIGGTSIYAFSRVLGLRPVAAAMTMVSFGFGPFLYGQNQVFTVSCQVMTWIPVGLLGIECGVRAKRRLFRAAWAALAALAVSQIAAAWIGQGFVNAILVLGGWLAYRTVVSPPSPDVAFLGRAVRALEIGTATILGGLALAAAGLLPRLSFNAQSNVPNGDYSNVQGGEYEAERRSVSELFGILLSDDLGYRMIAVGALTMLLAIIGLLLARGRHGAPFFAIVYASGFILALEDTPVHAVFYLIPEFQRIHEHSPARLVWMLPFALSMLAGIAVQELLGARARNHGVPIVVISGASVTVMILVAGLSGQWPGPWVYATVLAATLLCLGCAGRVPPAIGERIRTAAPLALIALSILTPARDIGGGIANSNDGQPGALMETNPETRRLIDLYTSSHEPDSAAAFLQERQRTSGPFRFVGYNGRFHPDPVSGANLYTNRRTEAGTLAVLLNGRGAFLGLEQMQGHNPVHLRWYVEYIDAMNGAPQEYHSVDPFPAAIAGSRLFDMLNVRYIVVSRTIPETRADVRAIAEGRTVAYQDARATVYENPDTFERGWIVHQVRPNNDGECLPLFAANRLDGRQTACVDGAVPGVAPVTPGQASRESVTVTAHQDDALRAIAMLEAPGLVVFSEVYARGWNAYLDGARVDVVRTNHALRGVSVPAGKHVIELRFEPVELRVGLWLSGITGSAMLLTWIAAGRGWGTGRKRGNPVH